MKLIFAVVQNDDQKALTRALVEHNLSVTHIATTGGFLRGRNTTLMIGVEEDMLQTALDIIRAHSSRRRIVTTSAAGIPHNIESITVPMTVTVGGATVFVLDVDRFIKY